MSEPTDIRSTRAQFHLMYLDQTDLPGEDFVDVTAVFADAAQRK